MLLGIVVVSPAKRKHYNEMTTNCTNYELWSTDTNMILVLVLWLTNLAWFFKDSVAAQSSMFWFFNILFKVSVSFQVTSLCCGVRIYVTELTMKAVFRRKRNEIWEWEVNVNKTGTWAFSTLNGVNCDTSVLWCCNLTI